MIVKRKTLGSNGKIPFPLRERGTSCYSREGGMGGGRLAHPYKGLAPFT